MFATLRRRTIATASAIVLVAVAGCSSGDSGADPSTTAVPSTVTTTPPTTQPPVATTEPTSPPTTVRTTVPTTTEPAADVDRELARSALLTLEAFPEGWTAVPFDERANDEVDAEFEQQFDDCLGGTGERVTDEFEDREARSDDFEGDGSNDPTVTHRVVLAPDEATAIAAMEEVAFDGAPECLAGVMQLFFESEVANDPESPPGLAIGAITVERMVLDEPADRSVGYIVEIPFDIGGESASQYLEVLYQREGRALSNLQFASFARRFDPEGIIALGDEVIARLSAVAD